jgi:hypothetical protein
MKPDAKHLFIDRWLLIDIFLSLINLALSTLNNNSLRILKACTIDTNGVMEGRSS